LGPGSDSWLLDDFGIYQRLQRYDDIKKYQSSTAPMSAASLPTPHNLFGNAG